MKKLIIPFLVLTNGLVFAQYSAYYNVNTNSNVNVNANVNHNVNGSVFEYKTINTIDYGALQLANAQREKNRLEQQRFADERQKQMMVEISENPVKAYDYGNWFTLSSKDKNWNKTKESKDYLKNIRENSGFNDFRVDYVIPTGLFTFLNAYQLQNVSADGVTTDIFFYVPFYNKTKTIYDIEKNFEEILVGKEFEQPDDQNKMRKMIIHKKELNRATVYGAKGFKSTIAWEDKFENCITDNYEFFSESLGNGYLVMIKVRYYGNKSETDFEKLEGRRYYLKPLIEKIVSTAKINDLKIMK